MINIHVISSTSYGDIDIIVSENISIKKLKEKINMPKNTLINEKKKIIIKIIKYYIMGRIN
jgi:hypothetical protein